MIDKLYKIRTLFI